GPNSSVAWPVKSNIGVIAGIAQTATPDPLGESWSCSAFFPGATATGPTCLGFVWKSGVMRALPTLGANNGFATGANDRGHVVGFAGQPGDDPDNPRLRAFLWTRGDGIRPLGTLPGDVYSEAHGINERRQVVGVSCAADGNCRAFLWQHGVMTDLNTLVAP